MSERYDRYDGWASLYNRTMGPEYGREQLALLERWIFPRVDAGAEILDLCCGTGQLIRPLMELGYKVTGLDGSEQMLRFAAANAPGAEFLLEDARRFRRAKHFDAVVSTSASLNHIAGMNDLQEVFANVYEALKDGGVFLFDLNHPAQLEKWWRSQPTEGEIGEDFAWMVTPFYDPKAASGHFTVTYYRAPEQGSNGFGWLRRPLYRLLSWPRFIGLRLRLIAALDRVETSWTRTDMEFPVYGHDLKTVCERLSEVGFDSVQVETAAGLPLDADHSAHFLCIKKARVVDARAEDAEVHS
ncbi:MAG: class I SAM-dependent methyltransferase [Pseudomonadota bacterium]